MNKKEENLTAEKLRKKKEQSKQEKFFPDLIETKIKPHKISRKFIEQDKDF